MVKRALSLKFLFASTIQNNKRKIKKHTLYSSCFIALNIFVVFNVEVFFFAENTLYYYYFILCFIFLSTCFMVLNREDVIVLPFIDDHLRKL